MIWFTKITSSLSCSDSGEEFDSLSISSESESESSLILITPPTSTQCFRNFAVRPLGFPSENKETVSENIHNKNPQTKRPRDKSTFDTTQILKGKIRLDLRFLLLAALFSLLGFCVGKCFCTNDWKTPLHDKNTHISIQFL